MCVGCIKDYVLAIGLTGQNECKFLSGCKIADPNDETIC